MRGSAPLGGGEWGFALLAALLIATIALLATATLVAAVLSSASISSDDTASTRAADAAEAGVADALERLRWGWLLAGPSSLPAVLPPVEFGGGSYSVTVVACAGSDLVPHLDPSSPLAPDDPAVTTCRIDSTGVWRQARRVLHVVVLATPDGLPRGLVVGGDALVMAPTLLCGCGMYAAGDVYGREWMTLVPPPATPLGAPVVDLAYGGLYPQAGVHADGRIFASGAEEHAAAGAPGVDSDADYGSPPPADLVSAPGPALIGALGAHASDPLGALGPAGLDLALLDRAGPLPGEPRLPPGGRVYVVDPSGGALDVFGSRPAVPQACPATVAVLGDCVAGAGPNGTAPAVLTGALIVTGTLTVDGPLTVVGSLYARRLVVRAPLTVSFGDASGSAAPPGSVNVRGASWRE
ncbi:MAG: hypothetical protein ACXVP1_00210 [Thermoleophilia bacterium]